MMGPLARKLLTRAQAETAKKRAASFTRNVLNDNDRADEIEDESLDDWADETGRTITNPKNRRQDMAKGPTRAELADTLDQVGDMITDALDPALTREEVVEKLQEIDEMLNGDDVDDTDDSDADDDADDSDDTVEYVED
jgi:hypothetical protein